MGHLDRDDVTHVLAMLIVFSTFLLIVKHMWTYNNDSEALNLIVSVLAPMTTTILGYYFGTRAGEGKAEGIREIAASTIQGQIMQVEETRKRIEDLKSKIAALTEEG